MAGNLIGGIIFFAAGFVAPFLGYWWFQAYVFISPAIAIFSAFRAREYWPVVDPTFGFFIIVPALFIVLQKFRNFALFAAYPIIDWIPWLIATCVIALIAVGLLTVRYRQHIDREWAVVGTLVVAAIYAGWSLETLNATLPQGAPYCQTVQVLSDSPGGYRQGGPRVTIAPVGPYAHRTTIQVSWPELIAEGRGQPLCLYTYDGGLGWRWASLSRCG